MTFFIFLATVLKKLKDVYADKTFHLDLQIELFVSKILIVILFNYKIKSIGKLRAGSYRRFKTKSPLAMPGYVITVLKMINDNICKMFCLVLICLHVHHY